MKDLSGTSLGKYEVVKLIGKGSMGRVYLGHDPFLSRDVAIKVANPDNVGDAESLGRYRRLFFHEAKVAGMLKHPNIISVYDAGVEDDVWYIVMEHIQGARTLSDFCQPGDLLPMDDSVRILFKCARALHYAHQMGVVHRDVKPQNVLLTHDRDVKLGDFGVALLTRHDASTQLLGTVGSPLYMSPEQVNDETVTPQSDVFSLGVVMYLMLTGQHPFAGANLPAILNAIRERSPEPLQSVREDAPRVLGHILDRALKKKPAERYKACLDLAADLNLVFDHIRLSDETMSAREKYELVKDLAFFSAFSESELWEVINASVWKQVSAGGEIIQEGEIDTSFYVIVEGDVSVRKGEREVDVLSQGDCFGEMSLFTARGRTATIVARTPVKAMKVPSSLIEQVSLNCQLRFKDAFLNILVERLSRATANGARAESVAVVG